MTEGGAFTRAVIRRRRAVVTLWVTAAIACVAFLPSLEEAQSGAELLL